MNQTLVNPTKRQWIMWILCVIGGCIAPFYMFCHGTIADSIIDQFGINYTQYGWLNTSYAWSCGIGLFIVGAVVNKIGCKGWTIIGIALMTIGHAAFFFAPSYSVLLIARIISGFGNSCIYNAAYTLAEHWFTGTNKMGVAVGGMTAADGIGTFSALYFYALLIAAMGTKSGNIAVLVTIIAIMIVLIIFLKDREIEEEDRAANDNDGSRYENTINRNVIAHTMIVTGVLGGLSVANLYGPTMLQEMGCPEGTSGLISSMFAAVGIVSGIIFGAISDKMGKRKPALMGAGIAMVVGWVLMVIASSMSSVALFTLAFIVTGFAAYVAYPLGFALVTDTIKSPKLGIANGVIQGGSFIVGQCVFQQIVSMVKDATGSYALGLGFCAALIFILCVVAVFFAKDKEQVGKELAAKAAK